MRDIDDERRRFYKEVFGYDDEEYYEEFYGVDGDEDEDYNAGIHYDYFYGYIYRDRPLW